MARKTTARPARRQARRTITEDEITAIHEAGHALIAWRDWLPFWIDMRPDPEGRWLARVRNRGCVGYGWLLKCERPLPPQVLEDWREPMALWTQYAVAGAVAVGIARPKLLFWEKIINAADDYGDPRKMASLLYGADAQSRPSPCAYRWVVAQERAARRFLRESWPAVEALARRLKPGVVLTARQACGTIERALGTPPHERRGAAFTSDLWGRDRAEKQQSRARRRPAC